MEITQTSKAQFKLKTKNASILLSDCVKIEPKAGDVFEVVEPGEYEVEGISVFGYGGSGKRTIFVIQAEGLRVLHMGRINHELSESEVEDLGRVDVVLVPCGNDDVIGVKEMVKMIGAIEPTYVIPYEMGSAVESLIAAYERGSREVASLSLSIATMPTDSTEVVVLTVKA